MNTFHTAFVLLIWICIWLYLGPVNAHQCCSGPDRNLSPGHDALLFSEEWLGISYMHYYIDIVAHTMAFDTLVVGHWLGKSLSQQYPLNLSQLWDNQGQMSDRSQRNDRDWEYKMSYLTTLSDVSIQMWVSVSLPGCHATSKTFTLLWHVKKRSPIAVVLKWKM